MKYSDNVKTAAVEVAARLGASESARIFGTSPSIVSGWAKVTGVVPLLINSVITLAPSVEEEVLVMSQSRTLQYTADHFEIPLTKVVYLRKKAKAAGRIVHKLGNLYS